MQVPQVQVQYVSFLLVQLKLHVAYDGLQETLVGYRQLELVLVILVLTLHEFIRDLSEVGVVHVPYGLKQLILLYLKYFLAVP